MAQFEEAWTVNHAVGGSSLSWVKLTKRLQQASNPKIDGSFGSRLEIEGSVCHNNIVNTLKLQLCSVAKCIPSNYTNSTRSGRY